MSMPNAFVSKDYEDFRFYLERHNLFPKTWNKKLENNLKRMHRVVYSFALWDFSFSKRDEHKKSFIREIRSESVQIIPLLLLGYVKPVKFLERSIIENTLRQIYFYDHPVEYQFLKNKEKYFIKIKELIDYAKDHPKLEGKIEEFKIIPKLYDRYAKLSQHVHSRASVGMELKKSLAKIKFDEDYFIAYGKEFYNCGENINLLLSIFHKDIFDKIENSFDNFISSSIFRKKNRGSFRSLW